MSVTLITNYYSDICDSYNYGRKFLELLEAIIDAADDYFEGQTVDLNGSGNPDNRLSIILLVKKMRIRKLKKWKSG